ncbi:isochorismatase family cysteine hydrolase [Shouchella clausii]|uniref:cysteine hydrolase family protein n=1 Tax=Shouchella TaxID=2893057 RepID=UPI000BA7934E|nr:MULTISPECIES: isochorismatase family cysteine hydrolase [Shouchella]MCM3378224.1 cysteine hydrolase [Shouchella rhizosphaerae]PAD45606.1 isochorismatase [Shouchella clausii]GIN07019.1 isochorismatase [Shouchella clausii]
MKALLVIDYTYDFIADEGALTVGAPGQAIEAAIVDKVEAFHRAGDLVVYAVDVHEQNDQCHPETALFPPHNIRGTKGRELYGKVGTQYERIKGEGHVIWLDKTRYSAFVGTNLDLLLRERGITDVHLVGDVTDICVLHTAVYAYSLGYKLTIYKDGVASFDASGHEWALRHFQQALGATVV